MEEKKQKILLIKLSSLGDVIFNIPLANTLKDAGYEVHWLVSERGVQVIENNPCVDKTIFVPLYKWRKQGSIIENLKEFFSILKQIRAEKYDIAIDAQMMQKSFWWLLLCGAKRRITSEKAKELAFLAGNEWVKDISYNPDGPIVMNYLKYAQHLGINIENIKVSLPPRNNHEIQEIDDIIADLDNKKPIVVISPATTWDAKHWNKDNWKTLVGNLIEKCNLIFTGTEKDNELIQYISENRGLNLAGKTNLMELIELYSRADLVLTVDSGSAHLAWATGKPAIITIFTCTPKNILAPFGNPEKYISLGGEGLPCQPCFKKHCHFRKYKNACTNFPNPKVVLDFIHNLIFS